MGTSGAGGGGGGSGGGGGGGGGSGGGGGGGGGGRSSDKKTGRDGRRTGSERSPRGKPARPLKEQRFVQVLSRLKPSYIAAQFGGPMIAGITHDLSDLAEDLLQNRPWNSVCDRFGLEPGSGLADIREAILSAYENRETDSRVKETATATLLRFFEALSGYDQNVLYRPGKDPTVRDLDPAMLEDPLRSCLRLHYENILQREEPKLPTPAVQQTIRKVAEDLGTKLAGKLAARYNPDGKSSKAEYLQKASDPKEAQWLIKATRG